MRRRGAPSTFPPSAAAGRPAPTSLARQGRPYRPAARTTTLGPDSFAEVDRCYRDTMRRLLAWLADHSELLHAMDRFDRQAARRAATWRDTAWADDPGDRAAHVRGRQSLAQAWDRFTTRVAEQLFAVTAADRAPAETLVGFRAAQAALLRHGLLLDLNPPCWPCSAPTTVPG